MLALYAIGRRRRLLSWSAKSALRQSGKGGTSGTSSGWESHSGSHWLTVRLYTLEDLRPEDEGRWEMPESKEEARW